MTKRYPMDTSREEPRRTIRRICMIGDSAMITPQPPATKASVVSVTPTSSGRGALGQRCRAHCNFVQEERLRDLASLIGRRHPADLDEVSFTVFKQAAGRSRPFERWRIRSKQVI